MARSRKDWVNEAKRLGMPHAENAGFQELKNFIRKNGDLAAFDKQSDDSERQRLGARYEGASQPTIENSEKQQRITAEQQAITPSAAAAYTGNEDFATRLGRLTSNPNVKAVLAQSPELVQWLQDPSKQNQLLQQLQVLADAGTDSRKQQLALAGIRNSQSKGFGVSDDQIAAGINQFKSSGAGDDAIRQAMLDQGFSADDYDRGMRYINPQWGQPTQPPPTQQPTQPPQGQASTNPVRPPKIQPTLTPPSEPQTIAPTTGSQQQPIQGAMPLGKPVGAATKQADPRDLTWTDNTRPGSATGGNTEPIPRSVNFDDDTGKWTTDLRKKAGDTASAALTGQYGLPQEQVDAMYADLDQRVGNQREDFENSLYTEAISRGTFRGGRTDSAYARGLRDIGTGYAGKLAEIESGRLDQSARLRSSAIQDALSIARDQDSGDKTRSDIKGTYTAYEGGKPVEIQTQAAREFDQELALRKGELKGRIDGQNTVARDETDLMLAEYKKGNISDVTQAVMNAINPQFATQNALIAAQGGGQSITVNAGQQPGPDNGYGLGGEGQLNGRFDKFGRLNPNHPNVIALRNEGKTDEEIRDILDPDSQRQTRRDTIMSRDSYGPGDIIPQEHLADAFAWLGTGEAVAEILGDNAAGDLAQAVSRGAAIGSIVPGVGTSIGAAVGGILSAGSKLFGVGLSGHNDRIIETSWHPAILDALYQYGYSPRDKVSKQQLDALAESLGIPYEGRNSLAFRRSDDDVERRDKQITDAMKSGKITKGQAAQLSLAYRTREEATFTDEELVDYMGNLDGIQEEGGTDPFGRPSSTWGQA